MTQETTRRALFGFAGLASAIIAMPAIVVASMPEAPNDVFARYLAAEARFEALPYDYETTNFDDWKREENAYHAAHTAALDAEPATLQEFALWLRAADEGSYIAKRSQEIANRLLAKGGR